MPGEGTLPLDFDYRVDLHGRTEGQGGDAESCAGVLAFIAEDADQEIGGAVGDQVLLEEFGIGGDQDGQLEDLLDVLEANAADMEHLGQDIEGAQLGSIATLHHIHVFAETAGNDAALAAGNWPET